MGKRSNFDRKPRDFYPTPKSVIPSLMDHIDPDLITAFCEPCAGDGRLVGHLEQEGLECVYQSDIEPQNKDIRKQDAFSIEEQDLLGVDHVITNPPWDRKFLHPFLQKFLDMNKNCILLFDADWVHTKQARTSGLIEFLDKIVSCGRVKWIEDSPHTSKDNVAWHFFSKSQKGTAPRFYGRKIDDC